MNKRSPGVKVLSIIVAVVAYFISDIYARELEKRVEDLNKARAEWTDTERYVNLRSAMLGPLPTTVPEASQWLNVELTLAVQELTSEGRLTKIKPLDDKGTDDAILKMTYEIKSLNTQKISSLADATAMQKKIGDFRSHIEGAGYLADSHAWEEGFDKEDRELPVRYWGYGLSVLAILVAGFAHFTERAGD
jgi:hypothetical protein